MSTVIVSILAFSFAGPNYSLTGIYCCSLEVFFCALYNKVGQRNTSFLSATVEITPINPSNT